MELFSDLIDVASYAFVAAIIVWLASGGGKMIRGWRLWLVAIITMAIWDFFLITFAGSHLPNSINEAVAWVVRGLVYIILFRLGLDLLKAWYKRNVEKEGLGVKK